MTKQLIQDVSDTAYWIASCRAAESARADALFRDPFAARLAGERGPRIAAAMNGGAMTYWTTAMRTCIIDDFLRVSLKQGIDTVVNLGAGLDARPYRLDLPASLDWIEVDYPHVIAYKQAILAEDSPRCRLERIGLDLADRAARTQLFSRLEAEAGRLVVLTEGVVPYLDQAAVSELAEDLRGLQQAEAWIIDYFSPLALAFRERRGMDAKMLNAPFQFRPDDWFGFFAARGWRPRFIRYFPDEADRRGRPAPLPWWIKLLSSVGSRFASPVKRKALREFAGYVMLEPVPVPMGPEPLR